MGESEASSRKEVSEYEFWLVKKDFESKIRQDMIEQVLEDYQQVRDALEKENFAEAQARLKAYKEWHKEKRQQSLERHRTEELEKQRNEELQREKKKLNDEKFAAWLDGVREKEREERLALEQREEELRLLLEQELKDKEERDNKAREKFKEWKR